MSRNVRLRLRKIARRLKSDYGAEKVILYGSHALGKATKDSDVDLLVVAPAAGRFFDRMAAVRRLIRDLRDGLPISPIVLTPREFQEKRRTGNQFIEGILATGVFL